MGVVGRLFRREPVRSADLPLTLEEYISFFNYFGTAYPLLGLQQSSPGQPEERIGGDFVGLCRGAYKSNGVVFACMLVRMLLFAEARFQFRQLRSGRPGDLFGNADLGPLETPWPGGTTGDLLARSLQYADIAGNSFTTTTRGGLKLLRPDWVTIILGGDDPDPLGMELAGYAYTKGGVGSGNDPVILLPEQVAHFAPIPDPEAAYRGMSWLTPVIQEIMADKATTSHKLQFFENGATPNMVVNLSTDIENFDAWVAKFKANHEGRLNAYKTLFLGAGADAKVVGANLKEIDFKATQGAGETRIAAAAGVPPVIVGLSEGLDAATYCLPADELVSTLDGPRPIASLRPGETIWSSSPDGPSPCPVIWQGCVGDKPVYEIRTKNRTFTATDNHPVLIRVPGNSRTDNANRSANVEWRAVGELKPGDQVVESVGLPDSACVRPEWASRDLVQWLGAYMGDGSGAGHSSIRLAIPPADRVRVHYEALTADLFDTRIGHEPRGFRIHGRGTAELIAMIGFGGTARTKRIPGWIYRLPRDLRLCFLAGLMDTDGYIDRRGVGCLGFANRHLVEQARALFISCGIQVSNVRYRAQPASGLPNPGRQEFYDWWSFAITTGLAAIPTADALYRARLCNRRDAPEGGDIAKAGLDPSVYGFFTIRSITEKPSQPVYDISVKADCSFFAGGVAVHNSNYAQARRRFADGTMRPLWRNMAASLSRLVRVPRDAELWYDDRDIPFLQEDIKDATEILAGQAQTIKSLVDAGFEADAVIDAVVSGDFARIKGKHTGLFSVQLQPPGTTQPEPSGNGPVPAVEAEAAARRLMEEVG